MPLRSALQRSWYQFLRVLCIAGTKLLFCLRVCRRERIPPSGPVVLVANHQSHLDPVLVGIASRRPLSYLARQSLFRGPFAHLIRSLHAIPLDREGASLSGLREVVRRLKGGEATLVFPEGTRTHDGSIGSMQPGFIMLVRRSGATIVPVGIAGAYEAWPRKRILPRPRRIALFVGRPITPAEIAAATDDELLPRVDRRIRASARAASTIVAHGLLC